MQTTQHDSIVPGEWYCPTCEQQFAVGDKCPNDATRLVKLTKRADPLIGRDLEGRYTIEDKLGEGGMGAVYSGTQHSVGRKVAIKVISANLVTEPEVIKRFLREAKLASQLSHPHAVAVLDFGQTADGVFYLVMELVKGRTLDEVFRADGTFRPERVVRIGTQICDALTAAESLHIVHRDLKPSNIMLLGGTRDLVKVLDFGLAKSVSPDLEVTTMTGAGALLGTPAFMPPELALGHPCDGRADLYSLGCILYLLGSGRLPFNATQVHEMVAMHAAERAPLMAGVPDALAQVIDRLLQKDPAARYQTAAETQAALDAAVDVRASQPSLRNVPRLEAAPIADAMGATLASAQAAQAVSAPPVSAPRRSWVLPAVAASVIAVGAIGYVALGSHDRPAPAPPANATPQNAPPSTPPKPVAPIMPIDAAAATLTLPPVDAAPAAPPPPKPPAHVVKHPHVDAGGMPF